jgi:ABC-2 type transport system ATP-binding protein
MLGAPKLLILDEPMNGLDPDGMRDMREIIRELPARAGATVLLSSHLLSEVQQVVTHVGLMHAGQLVLQGPIADMLARVGCETFVLTTDDVAAMQVLAGSRFEVKPDGRGLRVHAPDRDRDSADLNRRLVESGIDVVEIAHEPASLEKLYMQVQLAQAEAA